MHGHRQSTCDGDDTGATRGHKKTQADRARRGFGQGSDRPWESRFRGAPAEMVLGNRRYCWARVAGTSDGVVWSAASDVAVLVATKVVQEVRGVWGWHGIKGNCKCKGHEGADGGEVDSKVSAMYPVRLTALSTHSLHVSPCPSSSACLTSLPAMIDDHDVR